MIDSHCHLHLCQGQTQEYLNRAKASGLSALVQVATDIKTAHWGLELSKEEDLPIPVYPSIGLYPSNAKEEWREQWEEIKALLKSETFYAIGEAGLDYYWDTTFNEQQKEMLRVQIELAIEYKLPIILHCRNSIDDVIEVLKEYESEEDLSGVWHCFDGSFEEAQEMIDLGMMISVAGIVTYKSAAALKEVAVKLPSDSLLIETDSPYLSPVPMRGKKNEPSYVAHTLDFLAEAKGVDRQELNELTESNTRRLFKLPVEENPNLS